MVFGKLHLAFVIGIGIFLAFSRVTGESVERKYDSGEKVYKLIPLRNVDYELVDKVCRPWLGKDGILVHEKPRNSILVYAEPEIIVRIRKFLDQTAAPEYNIRIDIDKSDTKSGNSDRLGYRHDSSPTVIYKNGKKIYTKPKQTRLILQSRRRDISSNTRQFIVTKNGSAASLWVGKTVADPSWLHAVKPKHQTVIGPNSYTVETDPPAMEDKMVDVGISLEVLPRYLDNGLIEVELYPVISKIVGKGRDKAVKVTSLATKVIVKNGAKVYIGGVMEQKREAYKNVFGPDFFKLKGVSEVMSMYITATVMKPGQGGSGY